MNVAVIGGGASGLISAGFCAKNGNIVDLYESNEKLGKKLYITGKGRCNVTNYSSPNEILENVVNNAKFLYSSLYNFTSYDVVNFFESLGTPIKIERGNRAFPVSDKSSDIIKALERFALKNGVNILLNSKVKSIFKNNDKFEITTMGGMCKHYDATIICTGGKSYSATGSTGDGYYFAKTLGHSIVDIKPALVPIILNDEFVKQLEGVSLKNVLLKAKYKTFKKELFGEMVFTSNGISGPIALSLSSYINRLDHLKLSIDFKPALTSEKLTDRIIRDIQNNKESQISTLLAGLLPKAVASVFVDVIKLDKTRRNKTLNTKEIENIVNTLKDFPLCYKSVDKIDYGIITSGGVDTKQINPKTMESKLVKNLYFAGEVMDVDALTGGYNLQIAFSTGFVAGNSIKD